MRGLTARAALLFVALAITPAAPSGQPSGTGTIVGHVKLTTRIRGTPLPSNTYQPRAINRHDPGTVPEIKNVVVYLKGVTYRAPLRTTRTAITQQHEAFMPRVVAVTRGSTVEFPNGDPFFHNV